MQLSRKGVHFLNKLFNIRTREWPRTSFLFLIATLSNAGFQWGLTIAYAAFLGGSSSGLETLPWILLLIGIFSIAAISIYTPFVDRVPNDKLLIIILAVECVGIGLGLVLIFLGFASWAYPLLYLLGFAIIAVLNPHQITYFNSFYNTQAAKRALPVVTAGYRVGGIVAGLTIPFFNSWFADQSTIIAIWLAIHLVLIALVKFTPYILKDSATDSQTEYISTGDSEKERASYVDNMKEGFRYTAQSSFLRWMAISTLLMMMLMIFLEYRSTEIFLENYSTSKELSDFLARLITISNIFILPMLLFGMSRVIGKLGLGTSSLIFPITTAIISGGLIVSPGLISASGAYLDRFPLRITFQLPIDGLLFNAVPARIKGRVRAFVNGLLSPIGQVFGGLLLLVFVVFTSLGWVIIALIGILAAAYLSSAFVIRKLYGQALIKMLEQEDYSFLLFQEGSELAAADPATLKTLQERLEESDDPEFILFMAKLISQLGGADTIKILTHAIETSDNPDIRAGIVDILIAADLWDNSVQELYTNLLSDPAGKVRQAALGGLERAIGLENEQFQTLALQMLDDPDIEVRTQILAALAHTEDFYALPEAATALKQILAAAESAQRVRGVAALGEVAYVRTSRTLSGVTRPVYNLSTYLFDSSDRVRLQAALAIEHVSENEVTDKLAELIIQQMSSVTKDPVERIRQATLVVYGRLGKREAHPILVDALTDVSPLVRFAAIEMMVQVGKSVVPTIHPMLDSTDPGLRKTIAMILCRIDQNEYGGLISSHTTNNLLTIYRNHGYLAALSPYVDYTSITLLQNAIQEQNQQLLEEIFRMVSALHNPDTIKIITDSLRNENSNVRANAIEALETLTTPQTARLIGPLYDKDVKSSYLMQLSRETWEMSHPDSEKIIDIFSETDDDWLRAIMIYALGEMAGTALQAESPQENGAQKKPGEQPDNLFDALADTSNNIEEDRPKKRRKKPADLFSIFDDNKTEEPESPPTRRKRVKDPLAALLGDTSEESDTQPAEKPSDPVKAGVEKRSLPSEMQNKITHTVEAAVDDPDIEIRMAARSARRMMAGLQIVELHLAAHEANQIVAAQNQGAVINEEEFMLSTIEKIIFLKKVPFFEGMTVDQLKTLANVCEEELFEEDTRIYNDGDAGGTLYVVVSGKVAIEKEGKRKGSFARLSTIDAHSYFGEMNLFDNSPYNNSAIALQDTLTLRLRREPLIALARQYPDLSLELINILSQRLREVNNQVIELTPTKPRELHKLFDQFD